MRGVLKDFWQNECGATSVEYALIAIIVSIGIIGSLQAISLELDRMFGKVENGFPSER